MPSDEPRPLRLTLFHRAGGRLAAGSSRGTPNRRRTEVSFPSWMPHSEAGDGPGDKDVVIDEQKKPEEQLAPGV